MKKSIFIIGTGRSGTHLLGNILKTSPEINVGLEKWPIFNFVTNSALYPRKRKLFFPIIISYYKIKGLFTKKHIADKSHPNIWLVDFIYKYLSNSYFIGIQRNPHPTVSSMLLHNGVLKWIHNWQNYPIPNKFLGITQDNIQEYSALPIESKCTLRWISHKSRLDDIQQMYSDRFIQVYYEEFFNEEEETLEKIEQFLELKYKISTPTLKLSSIKKWKTNLNKKQIENINHTLASYGLLEYIEEY